MAQVPWEVLSTRKISVAEAEAFSRRCVRDLSKRPKGGKTGGGHMRSTVQCLPSLQTFVEEIAPVETESFHLLTARGTVILHPCWQEAADFGSRMYLSNYLLKFLPEFEGIWVAFGKIVAKDNAGFIADSELWVMSFFEIDVECLVFRPAPGRILVGKVNQVRPSHVGLLVDGIFNACVRRKVGLHKRFELNDKNSVYRSLDPEKASLRVGALMAFKVSKYHYSTSGDISTLEGSILDTAVTGVVNLDGSLKSGEQDLQELERSQATFAASNLAEGGAGGSAREGEPPKKKRRKPEPAGGEAEAAGSSQAEVLVAGGGGVSVSGNGIIPPSADAAGCRGDGGKASVPVEGSTSGAGQKRSRTEPGKV